MAAGSLSNPRSTEEERNLHPAAKATCMHSLEATAAPEQRLTALLDFTQEQIYIPHMNSSVSHPRGVICGPFPSSPWPGQKTHPPPSVKSLKLLWSIWTRTGFSGKAESFPGREAQDPFLSHKMLVLERIFLDRKDKRLH